jgi:phosphatidate cytidylyltransferase
MIDLKAVPILVWSMGGVFMLISTAAAATATLAQLYPERNYLELRLRIRTWWMIALGSSAALALSPALSVLAIALISYLGFREFLALVHVRPADRRVRRWICLVVPIQYYFAWIGSYAMFIVFIPVYVTCLLATVMVVQGETSGFLRSLATLNWGLMTTVFALSHLAFLLVLPVPSGAEYDGRTLLFFAVFLTEFNDVAQYVWGKCAGQRAVCPTVSPRKTWEGLLGGVATTTIVGWLIAPWLTPMQGFAAAAVSLAMGVAGFLGDIVMSAVKRDAGVKDSGTLLPGHGGALDRLDSLIFTAPLFFHYVRQASA